MIIYILKEINTEAATYKNGANRRTAEAIIKNVAMPIANPWIFILILLHFIYVLTEFINPF